MKSTKPITICIIKPDMIAANKKDEIVSKIKEKGIKYYLFFMILLQLFNYYLLIRF